MNFKKTAYAASKGKVIALIKASYDWENTEGFIADGVVRPDVFEQQPLRILCILAESYGYGGGDMPDIEDQDVDQIKSDIIGLRSHTVKTPRRLVTLLYLILHSRERGSMITRDEWRLMRGLLSSKLETASILQTALTKVAWLNIKKASNRTASTRLDPVLVAQHARQNRIILSEQIDSIAADLTIVLGKVTFGVLHEINLLGPETKRGLKGKIQATGLGSHVLELSHPGYHAHWSYDAIYNNYETICSQMDWFGKC
jgi:hypothetical protein